MGPKASPTASKSRCFGRSEPLQKPNHTRTDCIWSPDWEQFLSATNVKKRFCSTTCNLNTQQRRRSVKIVPQGLPRGYPKSTTNRKHNWILVPMGAPRVSRMSPGALGSPKWSLGPSKMSTRRPQTTEKLPKSTRKNALVSSFKIIHKHSDNRPATGKRERNRESSPACLP